MKKNFTALKQLFIFDLDGTLVDAYQAIEKSLNFTRRQFGYKRVPFQKVKRSVGRGDKLFVQTFFPFEESEKALKIYREHHKKTLKIYSRLKPFALMLLGRLRKKGKKIAIASNRPRYYTNIILKTVGIGKYLNYVLCADEIKSLKPKPKILFEILKKFKIDKEQALYIGDMDIDLETARRAKMDFVFVRGGSSSLRDLGGYKRKKIVRSLKELIRLDRL